MRIATILGAAAVMLTGVAAADAHVPQERMPGWPVGRIAQVGPDLPAMRRAEPRQVAAPRADCGPGARPEPGMQGRVPAGAVASGAADAGYWCNVERLGREGEAGGYKVRRYVDRAGRECAYYDTTLLFPLNAITLSQQATGVAVLDMSDPADPVRTDTLLTPAMLTPHESLVLSQERGLLAAVTGNPAFLPGIVDVYDISRDCRRPVLQSSLPVGVFGHESGFAPDGRTFYSASPATNTITAVDLDDPRQPRILWVGQYPSHGLSISQDGTRAYVAGLQGLLILDVSEIQQRRARPQVRELSSLTWERMTIPQNAIPVTIAGRPYLVEIDEYAQEDGEYVSSNGTDVGAGRIIDISDERRPRVVSDLRLAVHQPENRAQLAGDPGASSPIQGYAGHYCDVPRSVDPGIVACSMIASGLRMFDIRDPERPREVAYHVAPPAPSPVVAEPSNYAMSAPAFDIENREVWYSDGNSGFYALRLTNGAWPQTARQATPAACDRRLRAVRSRAGRRLVSRCGAVARFGVSRRTFGGRRARSVRVGVRLREPARVAVAVLRRGRVVRRVRARNLAAGTHRFTVRARGLRPGAHRVRLSAVAGGIRTAATLRVRRVRG